MTTPENIDQSPPPEERRSGVDDRRLVGDYDKIKVGDELGIDSTHGPCSGGARYGLTDTVIEITENEIVTKDGRFSRFTGYATAAPWAYKIEWWIPLPNVE